jgi:hypothetical protein
LIDKFPAAPLAVDEPVVVPSRLTGATKADGAGGGTKDVATVRAQLDAALARATGIDPFAVTVFGGVADPSKLRFPFSRMQASDARDWEAIHTWASTLAEALRYGKPAPERRDPRSELQQTPR